MNTVTVLLEVQQSQLAGEAGDGESLLQEILLPMLCGDRLLVGGCGPEKIDGFRLSLQRMECKLKVCVCE